MHAKMVTFIRIIHGLITLYFLSCIGLIYIGGITHQLSMFVYIAIFSIIIEGLVVLLNHGDCPLGRLHHQFGDQKAFFELFLPKQLAKRAVPFFSVISMIGIGLLIWNCL